MATLEENGPRNASQDVYTDDSTRHTHPERQIHTPSSSPRRNSLKPVSPHKNGNVSVGRLSFLQSDNIDDHFEHIHESHDEIMTYLHSLEAQTQQTQVDVGQLYDRSKSNNQNLNKLLSSIAEYSREVTEEGSATKTDVGKILDELYALRNSKSFDELVKHFDAKQEHTIREIKGYIERTEKPATQKMSEEDSSMLLSKLQAIETQLSGLKVQNTFGEFRNRVESLAQENSKEVNAKLAQVLQSLQMLNLPEKFKNSGDSMNDSTSGFAAQIDKSIARFESLLESQSKTIHELVTARTHGSGQEKNNLEQDQADLQQKYDNLSSKYHDLERSYADLESKHSKLEYHYNAKLELFLELQSNFVKLGEETRNLQSSITNLDTSKYDKVQELHTNKVRDVRNLTPLQRNNRITSMPSHNVRTRGLAANNSDIEE